MRTHAPMHSRIARPSACLLAAVAIALLACGCAGTQNREKTARQWYEEGVSLAGKKRYPEAVEAFREAAKTYRDAELDADIQLALADAQFSNEEYPSAVEAYGEFLRLHPHHARADYAQLRIGVSWSKQMGIAERSQGAAHSAVAAYEALLRGYPRSPLLADGRRGLEEARRRIADHELSVGEFYSRRGAYRAAAGRFELVLQEYGDLGYAERALFELVRCYDLLQEPQRAGELLERLRREFPQSQYLKQLDNRRG